MLESISHVRVDVESVDTRLFDRRRRDIRSTALQHTTTKGKKESTTHKRKLPPRCRTTTNPESPPVSHLSCRQLCLGMDIRQGLSSVRPLLKRCRRCVQEVSQFPNIPAFTFSILVTVNMVATSLTLAIPSFSSPAIAQYFLHALLVQSHPDIHPYPTYLLKSTVSL